MKKHYLWIFGILIILVVISIPVFHLLKTKWGETSVYSQALKGYTNDASQLNLTKVDTIINVPTSKDAFEEQPIDFLNELNIMHTTWV